MSDQNNEWRENWKKFVHSYLKGRGWLRTLHAFESESQMYFDTDYCKKLFVESKWDDCVNYLQPYLNSVKDESKDLATKINFTIHKEIYLYYLGKRDFVRALNVLSTKLRPMCTALLNATMYSELVNLLYLDNPSQHEKLRMWKDDDTYRTHVWEKQLETYIGNCIEGKTTIPSLDTFELTKLFEKSLELQKMTQATVKKTTTKYPETATPKTPETTPKTDGLAEKKKEQNGSNSRKSDNETPAKRKNTENSPKERSAKKLRSSKTTTSSPTQLPSLPRSETLHLQQTETDNSKIVNSLPKNSLLKIQFTNSIINVATFCPVNNRLLLVGACNNYSSYLYLINIKTGVVADKYILDTVKKPKLITWTQNGNYFAVSYEGDKYFNVFAVNHMKIKLAQNWEDFRGDHTGIINDIKFDSDRDKILLTTCSQDGTSKIWDTSTAVLLCTCIAVDPSPVCTVCIYHTPDKDIMLITDESDRLVLFTLLSLSTDTPKQQNISNKTIKLPVKSVCCLGVKSHRFFMSGINSNTLFEIEKRDGKIAISYEPYVNADKKPTRFTIAKDTIAIGDGDKVKFWNINSSEIVYELPIDQNVECTSFSENGELLCTTFVKSSILQVFATDDELQSLKPEKDLIIVKESDDYPIVTAEPVETTREPTPLPSLSTEKEAITKPPKWLVVDSQNGKIGKILYSQNGLSLAILDHSGSNKVWKWSAGVSASHAPDTVNSPFTLDPGSSETTVKIPSLALSLNDAYLVGSIGGPLDLINNVRRSRVTSLFKIENPSVVPTCVKFDPADNNFVAAGLSNGQILIRWANRNASWVFDGHTSSIITDVVYLKDQKKDGILFSAANDGRVISWNITVPQSSTGETVTLVSNKELSISEKKLPTYLNLSIVPGKSPLLLVTQQTQIQIWDVKSYEKIHEWISPNGITIINSCFSARAENVYAIMSNQQCYVFSSTLVVQTRLSLDRSLSAIASHPSKSNQISVGTDDGDVWVLETQI